MAHQHFPAPQPGIANSIQDQLESFVSVSAELPQNNASRMLIRTAEYLTAWTEAATVIDEDAIRNDQYLPDASRYGCMGASITAADNVSRSMYYIDAITGRAPESTRRMAQSCELNTVSAVHDIQHRAGLDTVQTPNSTYRFKPGAWRLQQDNIIDDRREHSPPAPAPESIEEAMRSWEHAFRTVEGNADTWSGAPTVIRAAQAYAGLHAIRPFPDGNARCARTIALGILHEEGFPASGLHAIAARHRSHLNARLVDAVESGDLTEWCRSFVTFATEGVRIVRKSLAALREGFLTLAATLDRDALPDPHDRDRVASHLMQHPVDRPQVFAQRNDLDRETTIALLRPMLDEKHLILGRINGQQVYVNRLSLEIARAMSRPRLHLVSA